MRMKKIMLMIETASTKSDAMMMLNTFNVFGNLTKSQYEKGKELIRKEFDK